MSLPAALAADANLPDTAYFFVHARAEPGVMPRVLELFAKRGLVPTRWHSGISGSDPGELAIAIEMGGLDREIIDYIAVCLRQIAFVEIVLTTRGGGGAG